MELENYKQRSERQKVLAVMLRNKDGSNKKNAGETDVKIPDRKSQGEKLMRKSTMLIPSSTDTINELREEIE